MSERIEGIVDWFGSCGKAWGSINYGDGFRCFVHYKNILPDNQAEERFKTLTKGQRVTFEVGAGHNTDGTQALNVRVEIDGIAG